ncbi:PAS domain S-box protein [Thermoflexibacter ruber]|uniref:PAS domain S-box-containing protein n=1 Tax=Thermoflexibacter ruber TaxID=1003 RepID=A0A1I2JEH2_9BACT|nr:PAS domain S-box protein [Thermoflexibacter ruber]SFF51256.1 PAS domain S-box-containing protein [Thermoflexibacter ruber]
MKKLTVYHILVGLLTLIFLLALSIYFWGKERWSFVFIIAIVLLSLLCIYLLYRHFRVAIPHLIEISDEVSTGNFNASLRRRVDKTLLPLVYSFNRVVNNFKNATHFALHIGEGKFDAPFQKAGEGDLLGEALIEMRNKLKKAYEDEEERRRQGRIRGEMGNLLRQYQRAELKTLCDAFLAKLIPILDLNQGGIFLIINEENTQPFLALVSCYAYNKKKYIEKRLSINQGLIGQCLKEKNTIYLEEIPENYVYITSGLGQAVPQSLLLAPIRANEKIIGVLEVASLHAIGRENIQLVEVLSERLGGIIATIQTNEQTKKFLEEATRINTELMSKEHLMRKNAEELSRVKEELSKKLLEQQQESNLMKYILEAINKTNAAVEFDFEGNIISVNEMYLKVMGYQKEELIGQNERILLPKDEIDSQRYQLLWESLKSGAHITGEYRRVSKSGKEVWLNGTYNPIFDIDGRPTSVIQFAQFTTEEKEKDLDYASKIAALNQSVPVLELDLHCHIKTVNQLFANMTQYKRNQLIKKNFCELIPAKEDFQKEWEQIAAGEVKNIVLAIIAADNTLMFFHTNFCPIRNLEGKIHKVQVIMVNITEQKEMEMELLNKQEAMREALEKLELAQKEVKNREAELEVLLAQERAKNSIFSAK